MQDPWSLYWQSDCLDSCVVTKSKEDFRAITAFWERLAKRLEDGAQVLDLATGNGTVPAALLNANNALQVRGVDLASIDPLRYLSDPGVLDKVRFQADVDICQLPFEDESFDAVTSQFGIEYAPLEQAIPELLRIATQGGRIHLVMHHADSEIVVPARLKCQEMETLLADGGVVPTLRAFLDGEQRHEVLEAAGQAHLSSAVRRTAPVSGQIFEGVKRVMTSANKGDMPAANALCDGMTMRLSADRDRLRQLDDAALDAERFQAVVKMLEDGGTRTDVATSLGSNEGADDHLIGWQYCGVKS